MVEDTYWLLIPFRRIRVGLGDRIEEALTAVGITSERVERFVGGPCGCEERKRKLNELGWWALRVLKGKSSSPISELKGIIESVD